MKAGAWYLPAILTLCALLSACASGPFQPDGASDVANLLAGYDHVAGLTADEQRREFSAALSAHEKLSNEKTRLGLALMYLLPRAPWRDDKRVLSLLERVEPGNAEHHSARHNFAQVLIRLIGERQRVERDDQRKLDLLNQQLREERRKADEARTKSDEAIKKLDSLRAIDRDLRLRRKEP